jgi:Type I phosphodiesterase / nucleotide pyrophosphatase
VTGRRLLVMLVVLGAIGIPAAVLTATCAGRSCDASGGEAVRVPFCPLPAALKDGIASGFREGRSPDVLGVAAGAPVYTDVDGLRLSWPATGASADPRVPLVFAGAGVTQGASVPDGTTLDRVAPTVSDILGFERAHPEVRSGTSIAGVADGERPRLVLLIAWKGVGSADLEARMDDWPFLSSLLENGAGTLEGAAGSLPLDPAATLTTIGTGGLPSQHGITGSFVRNRMGEVVAAFATGDPFADGQIIATLADDLDHANPSTLVGLVATDERDRGIVGGHWYPGEDPVDSMIGDSATSPLSVKGHLTTGYGADDVPDVIGVVLDGRVRSMDRWTREIVTEAGRATSGSTVVVVAGTGSSETGRLAVPDKGLVDAVEEAVPGDAPPVAATVPGGLFLDQSVLHDEQVTGQVAVDALLAATGPDGERMLADAFQGFAVSFARYC